MATKRSTNMLNAIVNISQSLIEHHLQKKNILYKILVKLRALKQIKSSNHFKKIYMYMYMYFDLALFTIDH